MKLQRIAALLTALSSGLVSTASWAEDSATVNTGEGSFNAPAQGGNTTTTTNTYVSPLGLPQPGVDLNSGLPSSSRPRSGDERDTFDLGTSPGAPVIAGTKGSAGILRTQPMTRAPEIHNVKQGDTLWDLCAHYYNSPWAWPKVWSFNPQIQNPHWIYPGDQLRFAEAADARTALDSAAFPSERTRTLGARGARSALGGRPQADTTSVFLRDFGYIGDANRDVWGEVIGAVEDQLLLGQGNQLYLEVRPGKDVKVGDTLTVFREQHRPEDVPGARRPPGDVVAIQGTLVVDHYNPKTRVARAYVTEALDVIERGAKITGTAQRLDKIGKRQSTVDLWTRVIASPYPIVFVGQNQLVFLDKGSDDGLEVGNTVLIVRKGDTWRRSLSTTSQFGRSRIRMTAPEPVVQEDTPTRGDESSFPAEAVAELRVVRTEKFSSVAIVLETKQEIVAGDRALARKGY